VFSRPNQPMRKPFRNPEERHYESSTGDAGRDGYTVLSRADRETNRRPPADGAEPVYRGYLGD
jgi:hypothetical protein